MLGEAGQGLAAAHAAGLVHRDFKPANVLVGDDGRTRVSDFGLSRPLLVPGGASAVLEGEASLTQTGAMVGTPAYMAPEQLAGEPTDARSDQFSFCVTLVECLTGRRPFRGDSAAALREAMAGAADLDGVPRHLVPVLRRGLSPRPEARFPSMAPLLAALRARPPRSVAGPAVAAAVVLISLAGGWAWLRPEASRGAGAAAAVPAKHPAPGTGALDRGPHPEAATSPLPLRFEVGLGELRLLSAPGATRVAVGDPLVADVEVSGPGELLIRGAAPGETTLLVWTGDLRATYPLRVVRR